MTELVVTCARCGNTLEHQCKGSVQEAILDLLRWVPELAMVSQPVVAAMKKSPERWEFRPDEPFFGSQGWSYAIFNKEEARTFHALVHNVVRAVGLDPHALEEKINAEFDAEKKEREAREAARAARRKRSAPTEET